MPLSQPAPVNDILDRIAGAVALLKRADAAFEAGDRAASQLYSAADTAHFEIINRICALTEEQADVIEPALNRLEIRLFHDRRQAP